MGMVAGRARVLSVVDEAVDVMVSWEQVVYKFSESDLVVYTSV